MADGTIATGRAKEKKEEKKAVTSHAHSKDPHPQVTCRPPGDPSYCDGM
jgi:hypothetical protein